MTNVIEGFYAYGLMRRMGTFGTPVKSPSFAGAEIIDFAKHLPPVRPTHSVDELTTAVMSLGVENSRDPGVQARHERLRREIEALQLSSAEG